MMKVYIIYMCALWFIAADKNWASQQQDNHTNRYISISPLPCRAYTHTYMYISYVGIQKEQKYSLLQHSSIITYNCH